MNLTVLGAGAWGTALAIHASAANATRLWARDPQQVNRMRSLRRNARYLPEVALPPALQVSGDLEASLRHAQGGLVVIATPMAGLEPTLRRLPPGLDAEVVWLCKGFQDGTAWLGHEIAAHACPSARVGVLTGPSFALEVARGQPTALVAASAHASVREAAVAALHGSTLRIYTSTDPVGAEVGGAVKNVLAIATGIADGLSLGLNARAALVTRGLAEMQRLGIALGGDAATFMGLSGLGDLVLTTTGELSRNRRVGLRLAAGERLDAILADLGHVAEGVRSAPMVLQRGHARGVEMPIVAAVVQVLEGRLSPHSALESLMGREARPESA
ncbi:MAG TPA: NAD(P)H-dependent glycerol-3-phosphate dehydrogenase [Caldimonas sp.]|jgi:glycerol-3-phosphate dehydrogenase (NAD(P)+)|nr:NAD(P)H-dependent glycerol-3-phosphate dehydrogenase [Caldimonas sp.]HEX2540850.1 NAD(P)H-dependent glycerol-3-phosphate dehydrogenase [Caldimonas sp.]